MACQPLDGGAPQHVLDLLHSLDRSRYRIDVACPRESILWEQLCGTDVALHAISPARQPGPVDLRTLATLLPLVRRADVVHGHSAKAGFLVRLAAALAGRSRSCVFTPHGWSFWSAEGARARFYAFLERRAARWCATIVTLSEDERRAGLEALVGRPAQYEVIPNGVDLERFARPSEPVAGRVLVVGRFAPPKRHDLVLRAFAQIRDRFGGSELWFVGDGPDRGEAERLAAELGVAGATRFLGVREDVPELLARAACFVLASDYEGCPLSVLEAMAAGVPVVATRVGGVEESVRDGVSGFLAEPGRPEGIARGIAKILGDPAEAAVRGHAGRTLARERHSRERMAAATMRVYDEIVPHE